MDYIRLQELKQRGDLAETYNTAMELIRKIKSQIAHYDKHINNSLEEAEDLYVVSEANINAALDGLRSAYNTLEIYKYKG